MMAGMTGRRLLARCCLLLAGLTASAEAQTDIGDPSGNPLGARGPVIYGYVTTANGEPLEGARVEAYLRSEYRTDYALTNDQGFYSLSLTQESDFWEIRVRREGYRPSSERLSVWRNRVRQDFNLTADPNANGAPQARNPRARAKARDVMQQGLELARQGDRPGAIARLREALTLDPAYVAALNNLGVQLRLAGDLAGAETELRKATEIAPLDYYSHFNLGTLLYDARRFEEAATALEQAMLADPTAPMAAAYLGRAYIGLRRGKDALEYLQTAERLATGKLDLDLEKSDAWVLQGDLAAALQAKQAWLDTHPDDPRAGQVQESVAKLRQRLGPPGSA